MGCGYDILFLFSNIHFNNSSVSNIAGDKPIELRRSESQSEFELIRQAFDTIGPNRALIILDPSVNTSTTEINKFTKSNEIRRRKFNEFLERFKGVEELAYLCLIMEELGRPFPLIHYEASLDDEIIYDDANIIKRWIINKHSKLDPGNKRFPCKDLIVDEYSVAGFEFPVILTMGRNTYPKLGTISRCTGKYVKVEL